MVGRRGGYLVPALLLLSVLLVGCPQDREYPGAQPEARFEATPVSGNPPLTVEFFDQSEAGNSGIAEWYWDFGDSTTSTERDPRHVYYVAGDYTVSLRVTTALGVSTKSIANCVHVVDPVEVASFNTTGGTLQAFEGKLTAPAGAFIRQIIVGMTSGEAEMPVDLSEGELLVSNVYSISHDQGDLRIDPRTPLQLDLPFFPLMIDEAQRNSDKLYMFARLSNGVRVPIPGEVADDHFVASIAGLPTRADYAIVYRPQAATETLEVDDPMKTPTSYNWPTNTWRITYTPNLLQALTALDLGNLYATTTYDMRNFPAYNIRQTQQKMRTQITDIHQTAQLEGFISPSLHVTPDNQYKLLLYTMKPEALSSYGNVNETYYATSLFGSIVIDPEQLIAISKKQAASGSVDLQELEFVHAFSEELFRASFRGYDYPKLFTSVTPQYGYERQAQLVPFCQGLCDGLAIYASQIYAGETGYRPGSGSYTPIFKPRSMSSNEYAYLSEPLFMPASPRRAAYGSATQDFFFYVTNRYALDDPLPYIGDSYDGVLELARIQTGSSSVKTADAALTAARSGINVSLKRLFGVTLPQTYWDYACGRAYENSNMSKLRASDISRTAYKLNEERFESAALIKQTINSMSEYKLSYVGYARLKDIPPLTSVAIVLNAGVACDLKIAVNAYDWPVDSYGNSMRVKVYPNGSNGTELTSLNSETMVTGIGPLEKVKSVVVLISNVSIENSYSAELTATPRAQED